MQSILETVLPIFGLVFCGYVVGRKGLMSEEAIKGLNTFVFYFAIPALLFRAMAGGLGPIDLTIVGARSEEHTSELQSLMRISYAVFCLKKKKKKKKSSHNITKYI